MTLVSEEATLLKWKKPARAQHHRILGKSGRVDVDAIRDASMADSDFLLAPPQTKAEKAGDALL